MGQKVHPTGFRLGFNKTWNSHWYNPRFSSHNGYIHLLKEDFKIHDYVTATLHSLRSSKITTHLPKIYRKSGSIYILLNLNRVKIKKKRRRFRSRFRHKFPLKQTLKKTIYPTKKTHITSLPKSLNLKLQLPWNVNKKNYNIKKKKKKITSSWHLKKNKRRFNKFQKFLKSLKKSKIFHKLNPIIKELKFKLKKLKKFKKLNQLEFKLKKFKRLKQLKFKLKKQLKDFQKFKFKYKRLKLKNNKKNLKNNKKNLKNKIKKLKNNFKRFQNNFKKLKNNLNNLKILKKFKNFKKFNILKRLKRLKGFQDKFHKFIPKIKRIQRLNKILRKDQIILKTFHKKRNNIKQLKFNYKILKLKLKKLKVLNKFNLIFNLLKLNKLKRLKLKLHKFKKKLKELNKLKPLKHFKKKFKGIFKKLKGLILEIKILKFKLKKLKSTSNLKLKRKYKGFTFKKWKRTQKKYKWIKNKLSLLKEPKYTLFFSFMGLKKLKERFHKKNSQSFENYHKKIVLKKKQRLLTSSPSPFTLKVKEKNFNKRLLKIKSKLKFITNSKIKILIRRARKKYNIPYNPSYLGEFLANTLKNPQNKKRFVYLYYKLYRTLKNITLLLKKRKNKKKKKIKGFRIKYAGKLWSKGRSKKRVVYHGRVPLQSLNEILDYHFTKVITKYGVTGFKIWLNYFPRKNYGNLGKKSMIQYKPHLYLLNNHKKLYDLGLLLLYYKKKLKKKIKKKIIKAKDKNSWNKSFYLLQNHHSKIQCYHKKSKNKKNYKKM